MFCFKSTVVLGFFSYTLLLRYPQRKKYCDYGHLFRWIFKCRQNILWVKTESLFLKYVSTAKARCSTDQRSMTTEMLWVSLEERSRTNIPHQRFYSQLFCKIFGYFCWTLYILSTSDRISFTLCCLMSTVIRWMCCQKPDLQNPA